MAPSRGRRVHALIAERRGASIASAAARCQRMTPSATGRSSSPNNDEGRAARTPGALSSPKLKRLPSLVCDGSDRPRTTASACSSPIAGAGRDSHGRGSAWAVKESRSQPSSTMPSEECVAESRRTASRVIVDCLGEIAFSRMQEEERSTLNLASNRTPFRNLVGESTG